jgi:hypothetical protein
VSTRFRDRLGRPKREGPDERRHPEGAETAADAPESALAIAVELCDEQRFWEAHEFLEHAWHLETDEAERDFWKGLTQVAVGCCHLQRGNREGALRLLERGARKLARYPARHRGVDVNDLLAIARGLAARLREGEAVGLPSRLINSSQHRRSLEP